MMMKNILFALLFLPVACAFGQSLSDNPQFRMLAVKSMKLKNGKIDFVEYKKEKGSRNPTTNYYTLIFSKDIYYTVQNKKINLHFFHERDSVLYIVDEHGSYFIDYKKKEVVIDERDEVILMLRKYYPFAYFYSNQISSELLLRGKLKDSVCTDFSTTMSFIEQKNFTEIYNIQKTFQEGDVLDNHLFCYEDYEFRNKDTLLIRYVSKIRNPNRYNNGTVTEIETRLLSVMLGDTEYLKPYYYDYTNFCHDDFYFYDKRKPLVEDNRTPNNKYALLALEHEMMSLFLQIKDEQSKLPPIQKELEKNTALRVLNMNLTYLPTKPIFPNCEIMEKEMPHALAEWITAEEFPETKVSENELDTLVASVEPETAAFDNAVAKPFAEKEMTENIVSERMPENVSAEEFPEVEVSENKQDTLAASVEPETAAIDNAVAKSFTEKEMTENIVSEMTSASILIEDIHAEVFLMEDVNTDTLTLREIHRHLLDSKHTTIVYYVVLGSFKDAKNAATFYSRKKKTHNNIQKLGLDVSGYHIIGIGPYKSEEEVRNAAKDNADSWILRQEFYIVEPKK
ncbi:MAG: SPOR domain-containing protein [Bacteroidales bacterium]|jgi:hypothetical protein|nr:SPOR domain-containing protein [Bacteroidales bacterium]